MAAMPAPSRVERLFERVHHERTFVVKPDIELVFAIARARWYRRPQKNTRSTEGAPRMTETTPTPRQQSILAFIEQQMRDRGYPPSVREIGEAVGLTSTSTVHAHLSTLQRLGYLRRDPTKPRAIEVRYDPSSGAAEIERRPVQH